MSLLVERVVSLYFLNDIRRRVVVCRRWSQPIELIEFSDAGEYGTLEYEPLFTFSGDALLPIQVMLFAVSLQCTLGDRAALGGKNRARFLNRNVVVACRDTSRHVGTCRV